MRHPTPTSGGTWNLPPVPTSTVALFVSFPPEWHEEHPAERAEEHVRLRRLAAFGSTHDGAGGAGMVCTQPVSAPISSSGSTAPDMRSVYTLFTRVGHVGLVAGPVIGRRAGDGAAQRRRAPSSFVEDPDVPVVAALGVARGAGDLRAGLRVEHVVAGVLARAPPTSRTDVTLPPSATGTTQSVAGSRDWRIT